MRFSIQKGKRLMQREISLLLKLNHNNVVSIK